mgnify:CR=1 FL=1
MTLSVHSNKTALLALQNLNKTNDQLGAAQDRVSTGLKISNAKDNAAVWARSVKQLGMAGHGSPVRGSCAA